jgi:hypothetical protein
VCEHWLVAPECEKGPVARGVTSRFSSGGSPRVWPNSPRAPKKEPVDQSTTALRRFISNYLSEPHRDNIDHGCPVAGFARDAPRLPPAARLHFAGGLDDQITILAGLIAESGPIERRTPRERAIRLHSKMVGALILSRSVAEAAPALSNEILDNVQRDVLASLDKQSSKSPRPRKNRQADLARCAVCQMHPEPVDPATDYPKSAM